jgi:hypothetical protein
MTNMQGEPTVANTLPLIKQQRENLLPCRADQASRPQMPRHANRNKEKART